MKNKNQKEEECCGWKTWDSSSVNLNANANKWRGTYNWKNKKPYDSLSKAFVKSRYTSYVRTSFKDSRYNTFRSFCITIVTAVWILAWTIGNRRQKILIAYSSERFSSIIYRTCHPSIVGSVSPALVEDTTRSAKRPCRF